MYCAECLMRHRIATLEKTGAEPAFNAATIAYEIAEAATVIQGTALCLPHLVEIVQLQRVSALAGPDGGQIVTPQLNGARP